MVHRIRLLSGAVLFSTCRSVTYLLTDGSSVLPIPRLLDVEDYLDYVSNRVVPDLGIREALEKLWSASAFMGTETTSDRLARIAEALDCANSCGIDLPDALARLADTAFAIVIQDFQDPYTLNVRQLMKCCVEEITPDGRLIPFCAYNSAGYREQVRASMTGASVEDVVPNAYALQPILTTSTHGSKVAAKADSTGSPLGPDATNVGRKAVPQ
ncbi:MAG: hypothetical protein U5N53_15185 [Mycobacterium sp.]|nr:hypothetical protein [Mycobacterium sp.]